MSAATRRDDTVRAELAQSGRKTLDAIAPALAAHKAAADRAVREGRLLRGEGRRLKSISTSRFPAVVVPPGGAPSKT